jgi:HSP20 family protein
MARLLPATTGPERRITMELTRWDPFRDLQSLQDRMNRLFSESVARVTGKPDEVFGGNWAPTVDIYDDDHEFVVKADLPGLEIKDIDLHIQENILTLKGERHMEKEVEKDRYHRIERSYGSFQRSFTLPNIVDPEKVKARFKDGVLEIRIPKLERAKPKQIQVETQ